MRIALVQQHATHDREDNLRLGLAALEQAAAAGAELVCYAELAFEPFYPQRPAGKRPEELAQKDLATTRDIRQIPMKMARPAGWIASMVPS